MKCCRCVFKQGEDISSECSEQSVLAQLPLGHQSSSAGRSVLISRLAIQIRCVGDGDGVFVRPHNERAHVHKCSVNACEARGARQAVRRGVANGNAGASILFYVRAAAMPAVF